MLAYKKEILEIARKREAIDEAASEGLISKEEKQRLLFQIPSKSFTPGLVLRIGIGFGTFTAASMLSSVEVLLLGTLATNSFFFLFNGIVLIFLLENLIKVRSHFRSGVDDVLLYTALPMIIVFFGDALNEKFKYAPILICVIAILIAIAAVIRYADRLISIAAFIGSCVLCYFIIDVFKIREPFVFPIMITSISGLVIVASAILKKRDSLLDYRHCFEALEMVSLITLFLSVNFQIIESYWLKIALKTTTEFPFWHTLYMITTALLPLFLMAWGWKQKELSFLRLGFIMTGISFLDFNDFMKWFPIETAFSILGGLFILIAYYFLKLYKSSPGSFEFKEKKVSGTRIDFEHLVVGWGATMGWQSDVAPAAPSGGDFGGAGAKGEF
jgi:hypothetical protein